MKDAKEIFEEIGHLRMYRKYSIHRYNSYNSLHKDSIFDIDEDDAEGKVNTDESMGAQAVARRITDESKTGGSDKKIHAQKLYWFTWFLMKKLNKKKQYESGRYSLFGCSQVLR